MSFYFNFLFGLRRFVYFAILKKYGNILGGLWPILENQQHLGGLAADELRLRYDE